MERSEHDGNRLDREGASSAHRAASGKEAASSKRETMPQLEPPSRPMPSQFNTANIRRLAGRPAGRPAWTFWGHALSLAALGSLHPGLLERRARRIYIRSIHSVYS
ncbi:hypothetical protein HMPREF0972_00503 [Actinomyces sp. oral taxon 848 str. F0332]|nr:hypothetical protein HMPREF0972_00503 [Actinomyces sp. oral taxon 848 str. F0332]